MSAQPAAEVQPDVATNPYSSTQRRTLPEFQLYRPQPGHPDWPRLAAEAHELAKELRGHIDSPRRGLPEWRRRLRAYRTATRNYLINRRLHAAGREDLRPLYFIWTVARSCNFRCSYCDDHQGRKFSDLSNQGALTTTEGIQLLRIMRTGTPSVYFAGGEPTLRRDLPQLTRTARDLHYCPIIVNTNGSLLHRLLVKEEWRTWLADVDIIIVSLDGLDLDMLAGMWGIKRPQDVLRNLLLMRKLAGEMRVKLMINTVLQPGRIEEARTVLDLANDLGIWFCPVPVNIGPAIDGKLLDDPEYQSLASTILERKRAGYPISGSLRMNRRMLHAERLNCRNTLKPHIDYDGHLFWPCKASVNVKPRRIRVLDFANVDRLYENARLQFDPAGFHGPGANQCGANCNWAQNYTTDAYAYGLEHPLHLVRSIFEFEARRGSR